MEWQDYLNSLRERRMTRRERQIEKELLTIADKHRRAFVAECEPLYKELAEIEAQKPPLPIQIGDRVFEHIGNKRG